MALSWEDALEKIKVIEQGMGRAKIFLQNGANHWTTEVKPMIDAITPADKQVLQAIAAQTTDGTAKLQEALALQAKIQTAVDAVSAAFA